MAKDKYDWAAIKEEYVTASPTISQVALAAKWGVNESTLAHRCSSEGWVEERKEYFRAIASKTRDLAQYREARGRVDLLESSYEIIGTLKDTIDKISARMQGEGFVEDIEGVEAHRLLERLSSLSTSFEKMARAINLLEGGPDSRVQVSLADILGASHSASFNSNE